MDESRAEYLLDLIPNNELKQIAEGQNVSTGGKSKSEIIDELYSSIDSDSKWDDIQGIAEKFDRESDPITCCVFELAPTQTASGESQLLPDTGHLSDEFEERAAKFTDQGEVCESGFEIEENNSASIEGRFYNYSSGFGFDAQRRLQPKTNLIRSDFEIDVTNRIMNIYNPHPIQANGIRSRLEEIGLSFNNVGHYNLLPSSANENMDEFASEFNEAVEEYSNVQLDSGLEVRNAVVDNVKLDIDGERLTDADLSGSDDILDESGLRSFFLDEYDEDVVMAQIGGTFPYKRSTTFNFRVGYTRIHNDHVSHVKVKKIGDRTGDLELVREAHSFLHDLYVEHFVGG